VHVEDSYGLAYSLDGTNFTAVSNEVGRDPTLSTRRTGYYSLPAVARQSQVWLAFYFTSANHPIDALGVYIDEVVVRGVKLNKVYLPLMRYDIPPTPTPTPTPTITPTPIASNLYNYDFGSGASSDAQFAIWGGSTDYSCGTDCNVIQSVSTNGHPGGAVNFSMGGLNTIVGTAPNHTIPTNFELSADVMIVEGKADARFGLIFGASTTTFYVDDADGFIKMDPARNYYKFDLNIDPADETQIKAYRLQRYDNGTPTNIQAGTDFPANIVHGIGQWNTIKIVRQGSNIQIFVNGWPAVNLNDSTFIGSRKFGVDMHSRSNNNPANPLKIRFDNVIVKQLP
jgi:hypothetical protein